MSDPRAFILAITSNDVATAQRLLDEHPEVISTPMDSGISPLLQAVYDRSPDMVRLLVLRGGIRSVMEAAAIGDIELLAALATDHPQEVNAYTRDGWTALHLACHFGQEAAVVDLLSRGADVAAESHNAQRNLPLHAGLAGDAPDTVIATMLTAGAPADGKALELAVASGRTGAVKLLLDAGADPKATTSQGRPISDIAAEAGLRDIVSLLNTA